MSNYTKSTDFTAKDSLPSGDSQKVIRGSEFDTEFSAIATAVNSKADKSGDTVVLTAGTVSAPSLTTVGDTNTGVYFPAADKVAIATGGTQRVIVDDLGNVGVGTGSPAQRLDVSGTQNSVQARFGNVAGRGLEISTALIAGTNDAGSVLNAKGATSGTLILQTDSTERMRLDSSGNLGIGTSSPLSKLHVNGDIRTDGDIDLIGGAGTPELRLYQNGGNWSVRNSSGALAFYDLTAAVERLRIDSSGNLGLGVTPSAWSGVKILEFPGGFYGSNSGGTGYYTGHNAYYNGTNWLYKTTAAAGYQEIVGNAFKWYTAPSGTAGNAITFTQAMTLDASGNLGIGQTSSSSRLTVQTSTFGDVAAANVNTAINAKTYGGTTTAARNTLINHVYTQSASAYADIQLLFANSNNSAVSSASVVYTNDGAIAFRNGGGSVAADTLTGTERARITSGGDFLVGTTATTGSQTNTTNTVVGKITSNNGTVSAADNTATTMLSVSAAGASTFLVTVSLVSTDIGSTYTVLGLLRCGGTTDTYTNILTATKLTVSLSGSDLQVTQTSGLSATVTWSLLRLL